MWRGFLVWWRALAHCSWNHIDSLSRSLFNDLTQKHQAETSSLKWQIRNWKNFGCQRERKRSWESQLLTFVWKSLRSTWKIVINHTRDVENGYGVEKREEKNLLKCIEKKKGHKESKICLNWAAPCKVKIQFSHRSSATVHRTLTIWKCF